MTNKQSYIYILTNPSNKVLYTGMTGKPLKQRMWEHKQKLVPGFTSKYNVAKLVYFEVFEDIHDAANREQQIKAGSRIKKLRLINSMNPEWKDLYPTID